MTDALLKKCELFISNKDEIKSAKKWETTYVYPLCASIYTSKGKIASSEDFKESLDLLKKNVGAFSNFRSIAKLPIAAMLDASGSAESLLTKSLTVYKLLKDEFFVSAYLPTVAVAIAELANEGQFEEIARRTRAIYKLLKSKHPFITSSEDSAFAALLAFSPLDDEQIVQEVENCFKLLKPHFYSSNAVQSLSQILALCDGFAEDKCSKTLELFDLLKEKGCRYGTNYELPTLGVLAVTSRNLNETADLIIEIDEYLINQKGFGMFGVGKKQRLMYAGILSMENSADNAMQTAAITGTISIIVAQQAAMCAAVAASASSSASASS